MSLFGRIDKDLTLLRLSPAELKQAVEADLSAVYEQLEHHCIRLAWKEHARTGAPVRDLLRVIAGNAHLRLMAAVPNEEQEHDEELLRALISDALRQNEVYVCFGFLLDAECRGICRAAAEGNFPPRRSIFENVPWHMAQSLSGQRSSLHAAHAALLKLRDLLNDYRRNVTTNLLTRETIRIVAAVTGQDPQLSESFVLDARLSLMLSWVAEYESDQPFAFRPSRRASASNR